MPTGTGKPRTYSVSGDTANGKLNPGALVDQIEAEAAIVTALRPRSDGGMLNRAGDVLDVWFVDFLSPAEIAALDAVVAAHDGVKTSVAYQFWESNATQNTDLETWQNAISKRAAPMAAGSYRLSWYCELRMVVTTPPEGMADFRFTVDGNAKGNSVVYGDRWQAVSGWDRYRASEGERPRLELDFRRHGGGDDSVDVRRLKLGIEFMDV